MSTVTSQMPSALASVIGLQVAPHQLLNVPFTSGVVNAAVTLFMSTWKVTLKEYPKEYTAHIRKERKIFFMIIGYLIWLRRAIYAFL
jgi:hypothetical protein